MRKSFLAISVLILLAASPSVMYAQAAKENAGSGAASPDKTVIQGNGPANTPTQSVNLIYPKTGLVSSESANPQAAPEAAAESGIAAVIARIKAAERAMGEEGGRILTLKDAMCIAILNNRRIQIQEEEVEYAKGNTLYAKSLFMPQVNAEYSYTFNSSVFYSNPWPDHRVDTRVYSGYKNDNMAILNATETVYNGGANTANLKQANINIKIAKETLRAAKLDVEFETKRLFYGLLLAYETKRIAQDLVDQARAHYEDVKTKYAQGTASKFDVLQSSVQVSTVIPQLVNADNAVQLITVELKKLLVLDLRDPIKVDGRLDYKEIPVQERDFLQEAYRGRPEMILKLLGVDLNKWGIEYAKAGWLPQVNANASYQYRTDNLNDMVNARHNLWSVGVTASIALFDGFATKAKVDEAKARYSQARLQKDDFVDQLAVDIRSACLDLRKSLALIDAQKDSTGEAKEALRLAIVRFDNGVGTNLDVFDSEVSLAQVRQSLAQAIYDYTMAKAQLDRLRGREFYSEEAVWQ